MKYLYFIIAGLVAGVAGGMGMGGGTVLIPLLSFVSSVKQHTAQAVNLISFIPMAIVALVFHFKNGLVDKRGVLYMILPGVAFAITFSYIAGKVDGTFLKRVFGGFLILLSVIQFFADKIAKFVKNEDFATKK